MSRARDPRERELLRSAKRSLPSDGKACANSACPSMGKILSSDDFYKRGKSLDSYCAWCRRERSATWKLVNPEVRARTKRSDGELNVGKAPWCRDHRKNSAKCGCATGVYHKTPAHRAKIARAMRGNHNASGKQGKRGRMSAEHRAKISMAMRATFQTRREPK